MSRSSAMFNRRLVTATPRRSSAEWPNWKGRKHRPGRPKYVSGAGPGRTTQRQSAGRKRPRTRMPLKGKASLLASHRQPEPRIAAQLGRPQLRPAANVVKTGTYHRCHLPPSGRPSPAPSSAARRFDSLHVSWRGESVFAGGLRPSRELTAPVFAPRRTCLLSLALP